MQLTENKLYRKCQAANFKKSRNLPKARALPWRVKSFCCPSLCNRKMQMQLRKSIKTTLFEDFALRLPGPEHSLATIQFRSARRAAVSWASRGMSSPMRYLLKLRSPSGILDVSNWQNMLLKIRGGSIVGSTVEAHAISRVSRILLWRFLDYRRIPTAVLLVLWRKKKREVALDVIAF